MDDFRKPYEYNEEKRGLILLFIIMIITIDIYQAPLYIMPTYGELKQIPAIRIAFMVISILYILFILFTVITCYKLKKNMVTTSKAYLIVRAVIMCCCIIILFFYNVNIKNKMGYGRKYSTVSQLFIMELIAPLAFVLVFSIGWYLYFLKSKRCKELVKNNPNDYR